MNGPSALPRPRRDGMEDCAAARPCYAWIMMSCGQETLDETALTPCGRPDDLN